MSWVRIWVHLVFSTKNREPVLTPNLRTTLFEHIKQHAAAHHIWLDCINGASDHCHCLISLGRDQTISSIAQHIKGESTHWLNQQNLCTGAIYWQDDYWAVGVSESHLITVREYIHHQPSHHHDQSFEEETALFMKKYGWEYFTDTKKKK